MRTNVVYFRVMWRLCHREWKWLWNWVCVSQHPWQRTRDHGVWRLTSTAHYFKSIYEIISSGAQQNGINAMHCFAGNSAFCQAHVFKVLTHVLQPIASLSFVCIICQHFIPSKNLSSNITFCNFIYSANGILKLWEFYHSCPFAKNKQSIYIVFSCRACAFMPFWRAHDNISRMRFRHNYYCVPLSL